MSGAEFRDNSSPGRPFSPERAVQLPHSAIAPSVAELDALTEYRDRLLHILHDAIVGDSTGARGTVDEGVAVG